MTDKEYLTEKSAIYKRQQDELFNLGKKYVDENSPYKVGDIIKSQYSLIKISSINISSLQGSIPSYYYEGVKLKKDLTPFKSGETDTIHTHLEITKLN